MSRAATLLALSALVFHAAPVAASMIQPPPIGDYGDAPQWGTAYPWMNPAVGGNFPTIYQSAPGFYYVYHDIPNPAAQNCWFGPTVDEESNGNAGFSSVPPYDADECYWVMDGDAGLTMPTAYTYGPNLQPITCSGLPGTSLGKVCRMARWGRDIDITVNNFLPANQAAYVNVIFDWDHSGDWSAYPVGPYGCGYQVEEHIVRNMPIPPNWAGRLSQLAAWDFPVGPDSGFVWVRFTITNMQIQFPWVGQGFFDYGESEDYLLRVEPVPAPQELGDAPDGVPAYPDGTIGHFPTCVGHSNYEHQAINGMLYLGPSVDSELDGNHDACGFPIYDNDECFIDGDSGLLAPIAYTITPGLLISTCNGVGADMGPACTMINWGPDFDVQISNSSGNSAYLNVLADWDHDGTWSTLSFQCPNGGGTVTEQLVSNVIVPAGFNGMMSQLLLPARAKGGPGYCWVRVTVSDVPAPTPWNGGGSMGFGETEDYMVRVVENYELTAVDGRETGAVRVFEPAPNPSRGRATLAYALPRSARVGLEVFDALGRSVRRYDSRVESSGTHATTWDGFTNSGRPATTGAYFLRLSVDEQIHTRRVLLVH